jgi:hypothetical protein
MSATRTIPQKVGDWQMAFNAIREELTPPTLRKILAEMEGVEGVAQFRSYVDLARTVMANDRAAGTIAALITQTGIKPAGLDYGDDD